MTKINNPFLYKTKKKYCDKTLSKKNYLHDSKSQIGTKLIKLKKQNSKTEIAPNIEKNQNGIKFYSNCERKKNY